MFKNQLNQKLKLMIEDPKIGSSSNKYSSDSETDETKHVFYWCLLGVSHPTPSKGKDYKAPCSPVKSS